MRRFFTDRFTLAWLLLVAVTLVSSRIGGPDPAGWLGSAGAITVAVLAIAFAKVAVVIFVFMEVRHAPRWLQAACALWLAAVTAILLAIYFGLVPFGTAQ